MKTIGIIGSRRRDSEQDFKYCLEVFREYYKEGDQIVSGGCWCGGDKFAEVIAKKLQIPIKIYYAQWAKLGRKAGFRRNTNIAQDSDVLIALVANDRTGGAEDTIRKALEMNKIIVLIYDDGKTEILNPPQKTIDILKEFC